MPPAFELTKPTLDVGVVAHDVDGMRAFYGEVLGLELAPSIPVAGGEVAVHRVGTSTVKLWCLETPPPRGDGGVDAAIGYRLLTLMVSDLDGVLARAESAGISGIERTTFGEGTGAVPLAFLSDVDGNALELVGLPGMEPMLQVGLTVGNVERTRKFFVDALGLTPQPEVRFDDPAFGEVVSHSVDFGATVMKYWERGGDLPVQTGPISDRAGIRYVTVHVSSVADAVSTLEKKGVAIAMPPTELGTATIAFVADPDGNWFELIQR